MYLRKTIALLLSPLMVCGAAMSHVQVLAPSEKGSAGADPVENLRIYFVEHVMTKIPVYPMAAPNQFGGRCWGHRYISFRRAEGGRAMP